ncbi:MAG: signal recognition particle-docking protein FtsY [Anaerolineaceae bacterium]|nr:signal recognition particle-docking protein FtsY [Anaerolineaceae bacterium]
MADILNKWREGLAHTRDKTFGRISTFFGATQINNDTWDDLEAMFIQADLGISTSNQLIAASKNQAQQEGYTKIEQLKDFLKGELLNRLEPVNEIEFTDHPTVILLVGVNGSGKTTTAAKLAYRFKNQGKKVLFVAADTYRAAAIDQLDIWGKRLDIPVISGQPSSDPGAVTYDGISAGIARNADVILVDTAGRLHTRYNLMEEIKKVYRVSQKALPGSPHGSWLVLDATTGQNALQQAEAFKAAVHLTGIILAKLDSSAKGGMAFAIKEKLDLPILYAGLGERYEDLQVFDRDSFVNSIFGN